MSSVPHPSQQYQHRRISTSPGGAAERTDRLARVRYIALLVLAIIVLTGLVWWVLFIVNAVLRLFRRR